MTIISKQGVVAEAEPVLFLTPETIGDSTGPLAIKCPNDRIPASVSAALQKITAIKIDFPDSNDGRGFSIARSLRMAGYRNKLRASGYLISDQFSFAIDCGFDEVEVSAELLQRQPLSHWRYNERPGYRQKLRRPPAGQCTCTMFSIAE